MKSHALRSDRPGRPDSPNPDASETPRFAPRNPTHKSLLDSDDWDDECTSVRASPCYNDVLPSEPTRVSPSSSQQMATVMVQEDDTQRFEVSALNNLITASREISLDEFEYEVPSRLESRPPRESAHERPDSERFRVSVPQAAAIPREASERPGASRKWALPFAGFALVLVAGLTWAVLSSLYGTSPFQLPAVSDLLFQQTSKGPSVTPHVAVKRSPAVTSLDLSGVRVEPLADVPADNDSSERREAPDSDEP